MGIGTKEIIVGIICIIFFTPIFFIPTIVAFNGKHNFRWVIFGINFVLGLTGVGWIYSLIWALWKSPNTSNRGNMSDTFSETGNHVKDINQGINYKSVEDIANLLAKYNELRVNGAITEEEFQAKKQEILQINT